MLLLLLLYHLHLLREEHRAVLELSDCSLGDHLLALERGLGDLLLVPELLLRFRHQGAHVPVRRVADRASETGRLHHTLGERLEVMLALDHCVHGLLGELAEPHLEVRGLLPQRGELGFEAHGPDVHAGLQGAVAERRRGLPGWRLHLRPFGPINHCQSDFSFPFA